MFSRDAASPWIWTKWKPEWPHPCLSLSVILSVIPTGFCFWAAVTKPITAWAMSRAHLGGDPSWCGQSVWRYFQTQIIFSYCYDLNFISPQSSYAKSKFSRMISLGGEIFGRWLNYKDGRDRLGSDGIPGMGWDFYKRGSREMSQPLHVRTQQEGADYEPGCRLSADRDPTHTLILDSQPPEPWEINFCCI